MTVPNFMSRALSYQDLRGGGGGGGSGMIRQKYPGLDRVNLRHLYFFNDFNDH